MEKAGAIFLPCQGYGHNDEGGQHIVENEDDHGVYWARDEYDGSDETAMMKGFRAYFSLTPSVSAVAPRYRGMSAKLQEISVTDQEDEVTKLNQPSATLNCPKVFDAILPESCFLPSTVKRGSGVL